MIAGPQVYRDMVDALASKQRAKLVHSEDVLSGPLNNDAQVSKVRGFLDRTPNHAKVVAGGSSIKRDGYFQTHRRVVYIRTTK